MSLVAYGSSDESSDEEVNSKEESIVFTKVAEVKQITKSIEVEPILKNIETTEIPKSAEIVEKQLSDENAQKPSNLPTNESRTRISLPTPKSIPVEKIPDENKGFITDHNEGAINFGLLPQPKHKEFVETIIEDDDEFIPPQKVPQSLVEKPEKKEKGPVKISVPSLSDFKDLDKEKETKTRLKPSQKGTGLFAVLPMPRSETLLKSKTMVPRTVTKKSETISKPQQTNADQLRKVKSISSNNRVQKSVISANYDSNSDDEDSSTVSKTDFFSLSTNDDFPVPTIPISDIVQETLQHSSRQFREPNNYPMEISTSEQLEFQVPDKTLVSNVINLPKEEIIQKNKAEVGPKLPVPEQDYNIDSTGNLVFDEKAIEYLCGKRGVKRKDKDFQGVDIIEINGEDIKPDEREWMVKALTEEPVTRPISQGAGPSGQSKKKHQITYLAHQAKAMEVELKNTWAQNKLTRQQTQSKYGF